MPAYLSLRNIHKSFGTFQALKDVDLDVVSGELVCFLGPSGCGKTTLLRIIAGLEVQTQGSVAQGGRDVSRLPPAERDYGIVFQSYALFPNLSVADNVGYGLVNRRLPKAQIAQRVDQLLALVGLPGSAAKFPSQLSGGQQQRIALARALAMQPGLLLLDEPLSALDALERVRLRQEIRALQKQLGVTTVMVTHDQEEALSVADRIVVMNHGVIEQVGSPTEIYREPASAFVADFVGKVNVLPGRIEGDRLYLGQWGIDTRLVPAAQDRSGACKAYVRPEDIRIRAGNDGGLVQGRIEKIEFLGAFCHVHVQAPALSPRPLVIDLSIHFLSEHGLGEGADLSLGLMPERIKLF